MQYELERMFLANLRQCSAPQLSLVNHTSAL